MRDDRRGFLKTLGKLGVALGITTAACSSRHHGHHRPHHPKHPKRPFSETEALSHAVQKAGFNRTNGGDDITWTKLDALKTKIVTADKAEMDTFTHASNSHTTIRDRDPGAFEFGFTGFKCDPMAKDTLDQLQKDMNLVRNQALDNYSLGIHPEIVVPRHVYDYITKRHVIDNLDPYNWGAVFDVKWVTWHSTDARFATKRAYWEAKVTRTYRGIFKESHYRQAVELPMEYLIMRVNDTNPIKEHAKRNAYEDLVSTLRFAIQTVIDTDKMLNAPKADNK